jgi:hypothetical protein
MDVSGHCEGLPGMRTSLTNILTIVVCVDALGWILGVLPTLYYAFTRHSLPTLAGIRLLGGPFEKLGLENLIVAGLMFVVVSAFKILAAYWLSQARLDGAILELILLGLSGAFWYGFALPLGPPLGLAQVVLLVLVWRSLH